MSSDDVPTRPATRRLAVLTALLLAAACKSSGPSRGSDDEGADGGSGGGGATAGAGGAGRGGAAGEAAGGGNAGAAGTLAGGAGAAAGGGGQTAPTATGTCAPPKLKLTRVIPAGLLDETVALVQPAGDPKLYVVARRGQIRTITNGQLDATPFADLRTAVVPLVDTKSERGLLNLAFHPSDPNRFFIYYTRNVNDPYSQGDEGDVVLAEGKRSSTNPATADKSYKVLVQRKHPQRYHNGGFLAFGPDKHLYLGVGEDGEDGYTAYNAGRPPGDMMPHPQMPGPATALDTPIGKILRVDVDHPDQRVAGNWDGPGALPWIFALGARNPWRGSFDRATGDLIVGDVGEGSWEEIDLVPTGATKVHLGWGFMEGTHCFPWFLGLPCEPVGTPPIYEYFHDGMGVTTDPKSYMMMGMACGNGTDSNCSRAVIGGYVYRGKAIKDLVGRYLFGDHVKNEIHSFLYVGGKITCEADLTADLVTNQTRIQGLASFGEDANGELYTLDVFGNIYRIDAE